MTIETVVDIIQSALIVTLKILWMLMGLLSITLKASLPMLIVSLVVGLIISVIQTVTSIQEQTLTFVPKLVAIFMTLGLAGSFIFGTVVNFTIELFNNFSMYIK